MPLHLANQGPVRSRFCHRHPMTMSKAAGKGRDKRKTSPLLPSQEKTSPQQTFHHVSLAGRGPSPSLPLGPKGTRQRNWLGPVLVAFLDRSTLLPKPGQGPWAAEGKGSQPKCAGVGNRHNTQEAIRMHLPGRHPYSHGVLSCPWDDTSVVAPDSSGHTPLIESPTHPFRSKHSLVLRTRIPSSE